MTRGSRAFRRPAAGRAEHAPERIEGADRWTVRASSRRDWRAVIAVLALIGCLGVGAAGAWWRLTGGSWAVIVSPSMGTAAPVGTLVFTRRVSVADLKVGDVVSYRPRNVGGKLYTHRVIAVNPDQTVQVRGDINGAADPLPVGRAELVGRVAASWPGLGWLVRALPTLIVAGVVLLVASATYVPATWRSSVRIVGFCLLFGLAGLLLRPFVHPVVMAITDQGDGPVASVVSTGIFPTKITGAAGHTITLRDGQTGAVPVRAAVAGGPLVIDGTPDLHGRWRLGLTGFCLLPMLWSLLVGLSAPISPAAHRPNHGPR